MYEANITLLYLMCAVVKTIANSAMCSSVSNFGDNYRYLSYKYIIGNPVWDSPLCKLHKCFDSYMSHSITVFPESSIIRDLCLIRDDNTFFLITVQLQNRAVFFN